MRRHPGVTALSATINCTIGSLSVCKRVNNMSNAESHSYCRDFCASHVMDDYKTFLNDAPGHVHAAETGSSRRRKLNSSLLSGPAGANMPEKAPRMGRCVSGLLRLKKDCKHYRHINYVRRGEHPNATPRPDWS